MATIARTRKAMMEVLVEPADLSERQWEALGQLRRLEAAGQLARRGETVHLGTLKALESAGLVVVGEDGEPDNRGRQWWAQLTEDGRQVLAAADLQDG
jgi:DNA-binding MarR family transcriptional regulator